MILQHGSILLDFSPEELVGILQISSEESIKTITMLKNKVADLKTALGRSVTWDEVRMASTMRSKRLCSSGVAQMLASRTSWGL